MARRSCHNCVYSVCDQERWLRLIWAGELILPRCANHPWWPGQLHDVPGVPCRNYWPKPAPPRGGNVRLIPFGDGLYAYVDAADYEELSRHTWRRDNGYAVRHEKGKRIYMHRIIVNAPPGMVVDHIDGSRANNCRFNLRICTRAENQLNLPRRRDSRSGYKGVFHDKKGGRWYVLCRGRGEEHWGGYFDDTVEAARVYDRMAVEYLGIHTRLNFPEEWPPERRAEVHAQAEHARKEDRKLRTENGRQKTGGTKEGKRENKARGKDKKPRAETPGRREAKRKTKAGRPKGKKAKAAPRAAGGTSKSAKRKTRDAKKTTKGSPRKARKTRGTPPR